MTETIEITSLSQYAEYVTRMSETGQPVWYRGVSNSQNHKLTPSIFRHPLKATSDQLRSFEDELMTIFEHRAPPFVGRLPVGSMELLFLMQHHGVPTRLLDCSENPFVSLFFALEKVLWVKDAELVDAAVWVIDPIKLNAIAFENMDNNERILSAGDDMLQAYLPRTPARNAGKLPVAMFGIHNSKRIVSQRGVFVLFGSSIRPMEEEEKLRDVPELLTKLVIKKENAKTIASALFNMGFTDSVIYPDLDGLGREIRNGQGFWKEAL